MRWKLILIIVFFVVFGASNAQSQENSEIAFFAIEAFSTDDTLVIYQASIFTIRADGTGLRHVTHDFVHNEFDPDWSPDGQQLVFVSNRDYQGSFSNSILTELYIIDRDGQNQRRLTDNDVMELNPDWSPDGEWITFMVYHDGNYDIYIMRIDGTELDQLTQNKGDDTDPQWSPDGEHIVFSSNAEGQFDIFVMNKDGSSQRRLFTMKDPKNCGSPSWSPDGSRLLFECDELDLSFVTIYMMNSDGTDLKTLVRGIEPAWAPDGEHIVFSSDDGLYILDIESLATRLLTDIRGMGITWQSDK